MCVITTILPLHNLTVRASREDRVRKSCEKLTKAVNSKQQGRIDGFFTVKPKENTASSSKSKAKGGKDDSKTKNTKRKVRSSLCRCRVPIEIFAPRQRRRKVVGQRRRGRKSDLRSSETYIPWSRGRYPYVTCIFRAYLVYYTAFSSPRLDRIPAGDIRFRFLRIQAKLSHLNVNTTYLSNWF